MLKIRMIRMCLIMAESPCLAKQNPPRSPLPSGNQAWQWKIPGLADDSADGKPALMLGNFHGYLPWGFSNSSCFITEGYELIWPITGKRSTGHRAHLKNLRRSFNHLDGPWNLLICLSQATGLYPIVYPAVMDFNQI